LLAVQMVKGDAELLDVAEPSLLLSGVDAPGQVSLDAAQLLGGGALHLHEAAPDAGVFVAASAAVGTDAVAELDAPTAEVLSERGELVRGRCPVLPGGSFGPAVGQEPLVGV